MNSEKNCFIMGFPSAGKTTYLAALWHLLFNGDITQASPYKISSMGDAHYLTQISTTWVNVQPINRTLLEDQKESLSINVERKEDGQKLKLILPDLSGETFSNIYEKKKISNSLYGAIQTADTVLLFVNVETINNISLISKLDPSIAGSVDTKPIERDKKLDPIAIKLIELLQIVNKIKQGNRVRLALMLSAWDMIDEDVLPEDYVKEHMKILWQFLNVNKKYFDVRYWGVSAQGGSIENESDQEKLRDISDPIDRIQIVNQNGNKSNDITLPIFETLDSEDE